MTVKFSNNAVTATTIAVSTTDTVLSVPAGHGAKFPALAAGDWFPLTLVDGAGNMEIIHVTARSGDVMTITRAQEGTSARAFNVGAVVSHRMTAAALEALRLHAVDQTARDAAANAQGAANAAQGTADAAQGTANAAKTSADNSVKTVNGVAPVAGNVSLTLPNPSPDIPNSSHTAIGAYALLNHSGKSVWPGNTASSGLAYSNPDNYITSQAAVGTWRIHGHKWQSQATDFNQVNVWERIA